MIGYAHTLVRAEPRYRGIVAFLVGRILVVDELRTGITLTRGEGFRDSIVTLEGDQIMGGGAITGGRFRKERSILARRAQAETLRERIPQLRAQREAIERDGIAAKAELDAASAERDEATKLANDAEVALQDVRTQLQGLVVEIERLDAALATAASRGAHARELARGRRLAAARARARRRRSRRSLASSARRWRPRSPRRASASRRSRRSKPRSPRRRARCASRSPRSARNATAR